MNLPTIRRVVLLPAAVAGLLAGGCVSMDTLPPYYSRDYYGPGPWGRHYYTPYRADVVSPTGPADQPVVPPPARPPPGAVLLPEPPVPVPAMGMPQFGAAATERGGSENGHPDF